MSFGGLPDALDSSWLVLFGMVLAVPTMYLVLRIVALSIRSSERKQLREMYQRLVMEKLEVVKTAVSMGLKHDDLTKLDSRMETIMGAAELVKLLHTNDLPGSPDLTFKSLLGLDSKNVVNRQANAASEASGRLDRLGQIAVAEGVRQRRKKAP